jgi:hypothetical protein
MPHMETPLPDMIAIRKQQQRRASMSSLTLEGMFPSALVSDPVEVPPDILVIRSVPLASRTSMLPVTRRYLLSTCSIRLHLHTS